MPATVCPRCGQGLDPASDRTNCPRCGQPIPIPLTNASGSGAALPGASGVRPIGSAAASGIRNPAAAGSGSHPAVGSGTHPAVGSGTHPAAGSASGIRKVVMTTTGSSASLPAASAPAAAPADGEHLVRRLKVVDGADQGHSFLLPDQGVVMVGSNSKHAEVCLHDLYVARVHCQLQIDGDELIVTSLDSSRPTFINAQPIQQQALVPGDILRVGNSYLRLELEIADLAAGTPVRPGSSPGIPAVPKIPRLPVERLNELTGYTLGHFKLEKMLGGSLFGAVFQARDLKTDQDVALKVLSPDFPGSDAEMLHLVQALRSAVALKHPSLVAVNGAGKSGPYCWISRELISGLSLAQVLHPSGKAREGLDWRLALRVAVHVGQALEVIHRQHLAHHNVTPQNILIEGNEGQVKLNDLLFRKALEGSDLWLGSAEARFEADLPYLAPEQTDPEAFVDNLCDLYSLGVVVYTLMTGRLPFKGKTPDETMQQIRESLPTRPKKLERSIPTHFQEVVLKLLAKRQEDRYATATELLADLDQIAKQRNVSV